jgi:hypothetical protein
LEGVARLFGVRQEEDGGMLEDGKGRGEPVLTERSTLGGRIWQYCDIFDVALVALSSLFAASILPGFP